MTRPVIGIISNFYMMGGDYPAYASGQMNAEAISHVAGCVPLMVPANPHYISVEDMLDSCDGFLFTGGRPNVHPSEYGEEATEKHGEFDRCRDEITLPLIRACVDRGQPFFGICRGFQEVNVAMGGTLYPEIRELEGRMNHRMPPEGTLEEKFALRHCVHFTEGSVFDRIIGKHEVMTNTLHGQGIKTAGPRVVVDGIADDGTPEAISIKDASGFALAVQWHPEFNAEKDPVSKPLFSHFGDAVRSWANGQRTVLKTA